MELLLCVSLLSGPVVGLVGDYPPDSTAGVGNITLVAGYQMYVQMRNCLAGSGAVIDANVERSRLMLMTYLCFGLVEQRQHRRTFVGTGLEKGSNVPFRNYEAMARRDWEAIVYPDGELVLVNDTVRRECAKLASHAFGLVRFPRLCYGFPLNRVLNIDVHSPGFRRRGT